MVVLASTPTSNSGLKKEVLDRFLLEFTFNRLYARSALRRMRVHIIKRERRLKALAPLLLCYRRAHHSIVDHCCFMYITMRTLGEHPLLITSA